MCTKSMLPVANRSSSRSMVISPTENEQFDGKFMGCMGDRSSPRTLALANSSATSIAHFPAISFENRVPTGACSKIYDLCTRKVFNRGKDILAEQDFVRILQRIKARSFLLVRRKWIRTIGESMVSAIRTKRPCWSHTRVPSCGEICNYCRESPRGGRAPSTSRPGSLPRGRRRLLSRRSQT